MPPKRKRGGKVVNNRGGRTARNSNAGKRKRARTSQGDNLNSKRKREDNSVEENPNVKEEPTEPPRITATVEEKEKRVATKQLNHAQKTKKTMPRIHCSECSKIFRYVDNFMKHKSMEHSVLPNAVKCDLCLVRCPNKKVLDAHVENVHRREIFECPDCKKQFARNAHVLRHMAQKGCDGAEISLYPCEICNAQFNRKDNLMVHLRLQHINRKAYSCKWCTYSTGNFSKLILHNQKLHAGSKFQRFECAHCGKVVNSRAAMVKHLEIHGEKKYACDVCGYSTFTIEVMRRHVLTHVEEKPYQCQECSHSFIQRSQLNKHMEKHDGKNTCKLCKQSFASRNKLMKHIQTDHIQQDKKQKNAKEKAKLYLAAMSSMPLKCDVCARSFLTEQLVRRHMAVHTLERPRRCMYCVAARAYVRGVQLVKHVRKSHPQVFKDHLKHVREVLGTKLTSSERVTKSELEGVLNVLDAETERIIDGYGEGVLYGGMQEAAGDSDDAEEDAVPDNKNEDNPLMPEEELARNLKKLLVQLIDKELLVCFGWPDESVDTVLEKVIENCGAKAADRDKWSRVQRLRENAKHLFLYVIEDKNISRMLDSHTIDQIIKHILAQVSGEEQRKNDIEVMLFDEANVETVGESILPVDHVPKKFVTMNTVVENILPVE